MSFPRRRYFIMSLSRNAASDLRSAFENVMSMSDDRLRHLFDSSVDKVSSLDLKFLSEISSYSTDQLVSKTADLKRSMFALNRDLESEMVSADRGIEPCIDSIESIVLHDSASMKSMLNAWTLPAVSIEPFKRFRAANSLLRTLLQNSQGLQEFLEIPQVMEQCIASSHYADAFALQDFFRRIVGRFPISSIPFFAELEREVEAQKMALERAIDTTLSTRVLKAQEINNLLLLHRLLHPKADLKLKFLECRSAYFRSRKPNENQCTPSKFLKDYAEVIRVQLADILNQFKILFQQNGGQFDLELARFTLQEIKIFLDDVERVLPQVPVDSMFQTMAELFQLLSYVRVVQVNSRINPVFQKLVIDRVQKQVTDALETFKTELNLFSWRPFVALIPDDCSETAIIHLTRHKPIAVLFNDITALLNDLRVFPLIAVKHRTITALDQLTYSAFELLARHPSAPSAELQVACSNFCKILISNIEQNLGAIFQTSVRFIHVRSHPRFQQDAIPSSPVQRTDGASEESHHDQDLLVDESLKSSAHKQE